MYLFFQAVKLFMVLVLIIEAIAQISVCSFDMALTDLVKKCNCNHHNLMSRPDTSRSSHWLIIQKQDSGPDKTQTSCIYLSPQKSIPNQIYIKPCGVRTYLVKRYIFWMACWMRRKGVSDFPPPPSSVKHVSIKITYVVQNIRSTIQYLWGYSSWSGI